MIIYVILLIFSLAWGEGKTNKLHIEPYLPALADSPSNTVGGEDLSLANAIGLLEDIAGTNQYLARITTPNTRLRHQGRQKRRRGYKEAVDNKGEKTLISLNQLLDEFDLKA